MIKLDEGGEVTNMSTVDAQGRRHPRRETAKPAGQLASVKLPLVCWA